MASIRKRTRAKKDVWIVDYRDAYGRRRLRTCATKGEGERVRAQLVQASQQVMPTPDVDPTMPVADYATHWLATSKNTVKRRSLESYTSSLDNHILPALGGLRLNRLHAQNISQFLVSKLESGLSRNTVRILLSAIRPMLSLAVSEGILATNPALGLAKRIGLNEDPETLKEDEVKAMTSDQLSTCLNTTAALEPAYFPLFLLLARTGLRIGEGLGLQWDDINLDARELTVRRTLHAARTKEDAASRTGTPKSRKSRIVDMSQQLRTMLASIHTVRIERALKLGVEMPPWVSCTRRGTPMDESKVRRAMKRVLKRAELPPDFTPHAFRHSFASRLLSAGESVYYVSKQLGHASIRTTVDVYGHFLPSGDKSAVDRLDDTSGQTTRDQFAESCDQFGERPGKSLKKWSRREDLNFRPADYEEATKGHERASFPSLTGISGDFVSFGVPSCPFVTMPRCH